MDKCVANLQWNEHCLVVTGARGRIGRALRVQWGGAIAGLQVLWSARTSDQNIDIAWNIGESPAPALPQRAIILHLAGKTRGDADALAENRRTAAALRKAAQSCGARHVFFMSTAAVYRPELTPIDETQAPDPPGDYGRAKLEAEQILRQPGSGFGITILRLGNVAGADALLSGAGQGVVVLDPVPGQAGGPERSYIGPVALAAALQHLLTSAAQGDALPEILNLAQEPALPMADLLTAFGATWRYGPPRETAIPRVALSVARLKALVTLPEATAPGIVADLNALKAHWP